MSTKKHTLSPATQLVACVLLFTLHCKATNKEEAYKAVEDASSWVEQAKFAAHNADTNPNQQDSEEIWAQAKKDWQKADSEWADAEKDWDNQPTPKPGPHPTPSPSPKPGPRPTPHPTPSPSPKPGPTKYPFTNQKPSLSLWTGSYAPIITPPATAANPNPKPVPQGAYRTANTQYDGSAQSNRWGVYSDIVPKPTNRWFVTSLIYNPTPEVTIYPLFAFPFVLNVTDHGLQINAPNIDIPNPPLSNANAKIFAGPPPSYAYGYPAPGDWEFSALETLTPPTIAPSSKKSIPADNNTLDQPLSVAFQWGTSKKGFSAYVVRGMPYVTFITMNVTPTLVPAPNANFIAIISVNGQGIPGGANQQAVSITGSDFVIKANDGKIWYLFTMNIDGTPEPITLNCYEEKIQASQPFSGVLRLTEQVTIFPDDTKGATIKKYAHCFPTAGTVDFVVNEKNAQLFFNWSTLGAGDLLMMALPHHQQLLDKTANPLVTQAKHKSLRGIMIGASSTQTKGKNGTATASWVLNYPSPKTTEWNSKKPVSQSSPSQISAIKKALSADINFAPGVTDDVYGFGKEIAKTARLGLIAKELNDTEAVKTILKTMQAAFLPWIKGSNSDPLCYDVNPQNPFARDAKAWGGICSKNGLAMSENDFGQGWYNDHHFHYGYFIYAAAAYVYLSENKNHLFITEKLTPFIYDLIRDIANPIADTYFPDYRMMDWYLGHSLAAGLFPFSSGKNQESTSEAVNAWYGIYLFGLAANQPSIQDLGAMLMATEIYSAQTYWFMVPSNPTYASLPNYNVYPEAVLQANNQTNPCVGVLWEGLVDFETFFSNGDGTHPIEYINLIHFLPFTPATELLVPQLWNKFQYGLAPASDYNNNPQAARTLINALNSKNAKDIAFHTNYPTIWESWKGLIYMSQAMAEPDAAWKNATTLTSYDNGNSATNTLYWIATQ